MITRGLAAWLLATVLLTSAAHAHGALGMQHDRCVLRIGPDLMFFTGYQPQSSWKSFATISQPLGKRLSCSTCKIPSSATCSRKSALSRIWEHIRVRLGFRF